MKIRMDVPGLAVLVAVAALCLTVMFPVTAGAVEDGIRIEQAVICRDVVDREPVGPGDIFAADITRLCCFSKVAGALAETEVVHNWYYDGKIAASVVLPVRSASWRTYSTKKIQPHQRGEWMVEILSASGTPLTRIVFVVN